jgi:hypothetical protein
MEKYNQKQVLKLVSPPCPSVNHYLEYKAIMRNGRPLAISYKTKVAMDYQDRFKKIVQQEAKKQGWKYSDNKFQHYYMDCVFYFSRVDCDANNYFKCMADAITMSGAVWPDDNQCCERVQGVFYDAINPRIEITITPVDYIGIFRDADQLNDFLDHNCVDCTLYKRNCQLLMAAKQGRIQPEINNMICSKCKPYTKKTDHKEKKK